MNKTTTFGKISGMFSMLVALFLLTHANVGVGQGSESFTNLPTASSSSYLERTWTGDDGLSWTAEGARTDQTINDKAICWGNSGERNVISPVYPGGMGTLSFKYVRAFTGGSARSLEVYVNNTKIGETITVSPTSDVVIEYSEEINIPGNVVLEIRSTGAAQVKLDDIAWTGFVSDDPLIEVFPLSLTGFVYEEGSGPSDSQSFVVGGSNFDPESGDITVDASGTSYEVSIDDINYLSSIALPYSGGTLSAQTVYVRLKEGLAVGLIEDEEIEIGGGGATLVKLIVNGEITAAPLPAPGIPYTEDFLGFESVTTLPNGWELDFEYTYGGDFGTGTAGGLRGNGVLGFQLTGSSPNNNFTASLLLENNTGSVITELLIEYTGKVARETQEGTPKWIVKVNGNEHPELEYSTADGVDKEVSFIVTGLYITNGEKVEIEWITTSSGTSGTRRQIGLANVNIEAMPPSAFANPAFDKPSGTYFADLPVFILNYDVYESGVSVYYTTDGQDPDDTSSLYDNNQGIILADGNGPITLKAIAIDAANSLESEITSTLYTFPVNVDDIAAFRAGTDGVLYRITGQVVVLHRDGFRNRHFVRDASGSLTIWDDNNPNKITTDYLVGDGIAGFVGIWAMKNNNGLVVMEAATDPGTAASTGQDASPLSITLDDLNLSHTGNLVLISDAEFQSVGTFANGQNYLITDPSITEHMTFRTDFFNMDYIGTLIPVLPGNLTAVVGGFGAAAQITARDLGDLDFPETLDTPVFDPPAETYYADQLVFISNFADYGLSVNIYYTTDGLTPDDSSYLYEDGTGISLELINGTVTLKALAIDTDTGQRSQVVSGIYTFPVINEVANIAALRDGITEGPIYKLTGEAFVTLVGTTGAHTHVYIQDETGAILIHDVNSEVLNETYEIGDGLIGITGELIIFQNMLQFIPVLDPGLPNSINNSIPAVVKTLDELGPEHQAMLVTIYGVSFEEEDWYEDFEASTTYNISDASGLGTLRTQYGDLDYIMPDPMVIPEGAHITGVIRQFGSEVQITPRSMNDFFKTFFDFAVNPPPVEVIFGTDLAGALAALPTTTTMEDHLGNVFEVEIVDWVITDYDGQNPGQYLATGSVVLPPWVEDQMPTKDNGPIVTTGITVLDEPVAIPLSNWSLILVMAGMLGTAVWMIRRSWA